MIRRAADTRLVLIVALAVALAACRVGEATPTPGGASPSDGQPTLSPGSGTPPSGSATPDPGTSLTSDPPTDGTPPPTGVSPPPATDPLAGISWQLVDTSAVLGAADVVADAAVLGSLVVAVGSSEDDSGGRAAAWYSADGYGWQPADELTGAESASIDAVAAGPTGLVAVGFDYSGDEALLPAAWHSTDGRSWTRVSDTDLARGQMAAVTASPSGFLALGADFDDGTSLAWTSADGIDWSAAATVDALGVGAAINGLVASGPGFVAFGSSSDGAAQAWHSPDGLDWQPADGFAGGSESAVNDLAPARSGLVAVGAQYLGDAALTLAWTSTDGTSWQRQPDALNGEMIGVEPLGGGFLAVGTVPQPNELVFAAAAWASADGDGWAALPDDPSFSMARMFELLPAGPGVVVIGERALDAAGEELAPAVWVGVTQQEGER